MLQGRAPAAAPVYLWIPQERTMDYVSKTKLFGLPLVHVAAGRVVDGRPRAGVARGWIAVGDVAFGVLFSVGGVSVSLVPTGGIAIGLLPSGLFVLGLYAMGLVSLGAIAQGGIAIALHAASGGIAIALQHAEGKVAIAARAGDPETRAYLERVMTLGRFFLYAMPLFLALGAAHKLWDRRVRAKAAARV